MHQFSSSLHSLNARTHRSSLEPFICASSIESYYCEECTFHTYLTIVMKRHLERCRSHPSQNDHEDNIQSYVCEKCGFKTYFSLKALQHYMTCSRRKSGKQIRRRYVKSTCCNCDNCQGRGVNKATIASLVYQCDECLYRAGSQECLDSHKSNWHYEDVKWIKCNHCSYKTIRKDHLRRHTIFKHLEDDEIEWHQCGDCSYRGKVEGQLKEHMKNVHSNDKPKKEKDPLRTIVRRKRPYDTSKCLTVVNVPIVSVNEEAAADETKLYKCDKCPYSYTKKEYLEGHILFTHQNRNQFLECSYCSYRTKRSANLKIHMNMCHVVFDDPLDDRDKLFKCAQCPYSYTRKEYLQGHILFAHSSDTN